MFIGHNQLRGTPLTPEGGSVTCSCSTSPPRLSSHSSGLTGSLQRWIGIFVPTAARAGSDPMWRVAFLLLCFSFQQPLISLLTCAPLPVARLLCGAGAGAAACGRFQSSLPWPPPALLFLFLSVWSALAAHLSQPLSCFTPSSLSCWQCSPPQVPLCQGSSHVPASPPPQVPECSPDQACPFLFHYPSLAFLWSHSPLWVIALSERDLLGHLWHTLHLGDSWSLLPTASKAAAPLMPCHLICWPRARQARRVNACTLPHLLLLKRKTWLYRFNDFLVLAEFPEPTASKWIGNFHSVFLSALK